MAQIKKCFGCLTLRQGTYMSAIYAIVISAIMVILCAVLIHHTNTLVREAMNEVGYDTFGNRKDYERTENTVSTIVRVIYWIVLAIYLAWFLTAVLVFPAVKTSKRGMLMPFLIFTGVLTGICVFGLISSVTKMGETFSTSTGIAQFSVQILIVCVNMYVMICISSFYKNNMKEADEVNALPVMAPAVSGPGVAANAPPAYSYNYHPAPSGEPMTKGPYPGYDYQQPPPVYGHQAMTQKI